MYKRQAPGSGNAGATNPEQLFAAGYSACFNSALELVMQKAGINAKSTVAIVVSLYEKEPLDYMIGADIEGHIEGPVSYTHLDVYKRQAFWRTIDPGPA